VTAVPSALAPAAITPQVLRVAAVWGTTVVAMKVLARGESFVLGDGEGAALPVPDGLDIAPSPVRAAHGAWELDPRGALGGTLMLRGRPEDPTRLAQSGAPIPVMPGDFGLIQYGQLSIFFQYTSAPPPMVTRRVPEILAVLAVLSSTVLHVGILGLVRTLMTPPPLAKPLELTNPDEFAARFGLRRAVIEEPQPVAAAGDDKSGGSGVKDPGAQDKKPQGGGRKIRGDEGKLGLHGADKETGIPGDTKPTTHYGGLSEVLDGDTGKEIQRTLKTIDTVSAALAGLNADSVSLGGGSGTGLKGGGSGGGGAGAGVAFGSGTMDTGFGFGKGGGFGAGKGGPGGRGSGGNGRGGSGGGSGTGTGTGGGAGGPGEARVAVSAGTPAARGGLSPEQIRRVVLAHQGALRACYESEAQRNPNLRGGITATWQIDPSGQVSSASIAQTSLGNARVEGCVVRQVKSWRFPASATATNVASYPFKFGVGG
jgi:hypothetical protein